MGTQKKIIAWVFAGLIICTTAYFLTDPFGIESQSEEGYLMMEACVDIKAHETLRAESDFDLIIEAINKHLHSVSNQNDTLVASAINDLRKLREEVIFHNLDIALYQSHFIKILNQLSYIELNDALHSIEMDNGLEANNAIKRAKHYLHDALSFSHNSQIDVQINLLHEINRLNESNLKVTDLQQSLRHIKGII